MGCAASERIPFLEHFCAALCLRLFLMFLTFSYFLVLNDLGWGNPSGRNRLQSRVLGKR